MNRLKELRQEKGLSQKAIAELLSINEKTIYRWENGESQIKPDKAQALADFFGVSVGYLLGYDVQEAEYVPLKLLKIGLKKMTNMFQPEELPDLPDDGWMTLATKEYEELGLDGTIIELSEYITFYAMELKDPLKELLCNFAKSPEENQQAVLSLLRTTAKKLDDKKHS